MRTYTHTKTSYINLGTSNNNNNNNNICVWGEGNYFIKVSNYTYYIYNYISNIYFPQNTY